MNLNNSPEISVLMPVYNGGAFLSKAIESILNQTYQNFEFIIINDGSKDGSGKVIDDYAAKDARIIVVHQENAGLIATLNRGIALAKALLIARMDADDIALPERFEKQINFLQANPDIVVLGTSIRLIDENDHPIQDMIYPSTVQDVANAMLRTNPLAHPTVMLRKEIVEAAGGYNPVYRHAEDYELWLRLSEKYKMANLPEIYLLYRQHPDKISFQHSREQTLKTIVAMLASKTRRNGKPDPISRDEVITFDTLKLFKLSPREESELLFKTYEYTLNAHIFNKDEKPVLEVIAQAKEAACGCHHNRFLSLVLQKASLFYVTNKQYGKAFKLMTEAFLKSPMAFFKTFFRISLKIAKRFIKRVYRKITNNYED